MELREQLEEFGTDLEEMLDYLDDLRESGITNMFGATPYIEDTFALSRKVSSACLLYWMTTFCDRHP